MRCAKAINLVLALGALAAVCTSCVDNAGREISTVDAGVPDGSVTPLPTPPSAALAVATRTRVPFPAQDQAAQLAKRYPAYGVALSYMSAVYEGPKSDARVLGYMRRGSEFRAGEEISRQGCARGWFEVPGEGYVCNGNGFVLDSQPRSNSAAPVLATLAEALPYRYAKVVSSRVPQYTRLPSAAEERAVTEALSKAVGSAGSDAGTPAAPTLPSELAPLLRVAMEPGFYVSVEAEERDPADAKRVFVRTVRGGYVRADKLIPAKLPEPMGVTLGQRLKLPLAFVYRGGAPKLTRDPVSGEAKKLGGDLPLHSAHPLTGEVIERSGRRYYVTTDGLLLRDTAVRVVKATSRPALSKANEPWIRVDLTQQTLTAYEGDTPVFATLVSSGVTDHATPPGLFRLHAKHTTATMADNLAVDGPYSIEDVPWTMYFNGSFALHAAFWHERFGHPRSHGCINLTPRDARWLFFWTQPALPSAWHGVLPNVGQGTLVLIDPGDAPTAGEQT